MIPMLILAAAAATAQPDCAALIAEARPAIDHANDDWVRALKAGDAAAIAEAYAEDGLFVLPDGTMVKGRAAVQQLYAGQAKAAAAIVGGGIASERTVCGGDGLLYEWGQGRLRLKAADGREVERGGPYLTVWKRIGGGWKIVRNLAF
jgi:uncharacterized protein (TIGR02246 family)